MIDKEQKLNVIPERKQQPQLHTQSSACTNREANNSRYQQQQQQPPALQPSTSSQSNKPQSDRHSEIMKNWYPLRFKLNYPCKSALKSNEQKEFIDMYKRFLSRTHLNQKEVKTYKLYVVN